MKRRATLLALCLIAVLAGLVGALASEGPDPPSPQSVLAEVERTADVPDRRPSPDPYTSPRYEPYADGKKVAARAAQRALTYSRNEMPAAIAERVRARVDDGLARVLAPAIERDVRSAGTVVYPQLSGLTESSMGVMVVARQRLQDAAGRWTSVTRTVDVRLTGVDGAWQVESISSVGGPPARRPDELSVAATAVVDNPAIELPDTARWDIYRGLVDPTLLEAMASAAERAPIAVAVLDSGHPTNVWATSTPSAHSSGAAVDIWAVDGTPVAEQVETGSAAYEMASAFVSGGAAQVGSPWVLGPGGATSFTDEVHRDHVHLQQSG
ncbi:hypothetical protein HJD18_15610 [Thermoleophilia bacterium SCSIO 60948]|nr:hypothetical protein HJD18_15610 [Thermoleophilia bacterium SCSIO 60948]